MLETIFGSILAGNAAATVESVRQAIDEGLAPGQILKEGMIAAMNEIGKRFEKGEVFVPEMMVAARAMQSGMDVLRPYLIEADVKPIAKIVLGTVKGDLHDIGKNLVKMMMEGAGIEVIDLGTDVSPEKYLNAVLAAKPSLVGMSALLTTTMNNMKSVIEALEDANLRAGVKVLVGGAPLTQKFAQEIGADCYAPDASSAVRVAKEALGVTGT